MASTTAVAPRSVVIIGAGLGGLTLALSLEKVGIKSKLYELRTPEYDFGGAIMLSPNAIRVLDRLDVYSRIQNHGYDFDTMTFMNDADYEITGVYYFGQKEMYGYNALRIYRNVLIKEMRKIVSEKGIAIEYGRKFSHIVSEDSKSVKFAFADGSEEETELLLGADGIHSKVRQHILPGIIPAYSGFLGVTYAFPLSKLRLPSSNFPLPVSIHGKNGAYVMAPQSADGKEIFAGRQFRYSMQERSAWDALLKERNELITMHQSDIDQWSDVVRSGQEQANSPDSHSLNIWPFHTVPKLEKWSSDQGRIIIVGDAAHAIPPTAGQGANQAFEDSYSLAILLKSLSKDSELKTSLKKWQDYRQERVDKVLFLSAQMNNLRLSEEEKKGIPEEMIWHEGEANELGWLYLNDIEQDMEKVLA